MASRAFVGLTARALAAVDGDVTLPQFRAMVVIAVRGPQRVSDITDEVQVNPSTATRMSTAWCVRASSAGPGTPTIAAWCSYA